MTTTRLAVALLASCFTAPSVLAAARPWIEVRSPHFVVISDASDKQARNVAWQFEQVHSLLPRMWPWARVKLARPTVVLAARDEESMKALLPEYWERKEAIGPSAFLITGRARHYIAVRADVHGQSDDPRENPYRMTYWAYVMLVLEESFEQPLPLWFSRGIAGVFANTKVLNEVVEVGRVIPWQLQLLRAGEPLSFQSLRAVDRESPYYKQGDQLEVFDAHAWAAIHFLMFADNGAHQAQLNRYSALLQSGTRPDAALAEAFPDLPAIEKNLDLYVRNLGFAFARPKIDLDVKQEGFAVRPVSVADAAAAQAAFHIATGRPVEARALIAQGRKAEPASSALFESEGLLAEAEGRGEDANSAYAKAAEQAEAGYYALYRHAQALHGDSPDKDTLARIEAALRRSVDKYPDYANAQSYLADILARLGKAAEGEGLARKAIALEPTKAYHRLALARVLTTLHRSDEARLEGEKSLSLARSPEEQANARSFLEHLQGPRPEVVGGKIAAATPVAKVAAPVAAPVPTQSLSSLWTVMKNGCTTVQTGSSLHVSGVTNQDGWNHWNGVITKDNYAAGDFTVSADFKLPLFAGSSPGGTPLVYLRVSAAGGDQLGIFFTPGGGYRVQAWGTPHIFSPWLPPIGDEATVFHRMTLRYEAATRTATGWVDDRQIGSIQAPLAGRLQFWLAANTNKAGMKVDLYFDNFSMTVGREYRSAALRRGHRSRPSAA